MSLVELALAYDEARAAYEEALALDVRFRPAVEPPALERPGPGDRETDAAS